MQELRLFVITAVCVVVTLTTSIAADQAAAQAHVHVQVANTNENRATAVLEKLAPRSSSTRAANRPHDWDDTQDHDPKTSIPTASPPMTVAPATTKTPAPTTAAPKPLAPTATTPTTLGPVAYKPVQPTPVTTSAATPSYPYRPVRVHVPQLNVTLDICIHDSDYKVKVANKDGWFCVNDIPCGSTNGNGLCPGVLQPDLPFGSYCDPVLGNKPPAGERVTFVRKAQTRSTKDDREQQVGPRSKSSVVHARKCAHSSATHESDTYTLTLHCTWLSFFMFCLIEHKARHNVLVPSTSALGTASQLHGSLQCHHNAPLSVLSFAHCGSTQEVVRRCARDALSASVHTFTQSM